MDLISPVGIIAFLLWYSCGFFAVPLLPWNKWKLNRTLRDVLVIPAMLFGPLSLLAGGLITLSMKLSESREANLRKSELAQLDAIILPENNSGFPVPGHDGSSDDGKLELKRLINTAINHAVSDIFLEPLPDNICSVRMHISGGLQETSRLKSESAAKLITAVKTAAMLDITDNRRPQNGSFSAKVNGSEIIFKIATAGTHAGEKIAIRMVGSTFIPTTVEQLPLLPSEREQLSQILRLPSGIIIVSGPAGSGKSTTSYALLRTLLAQGRTICSIENKIQSVIPGISQMEVVQPAGITAANLLASALQQYTQVIAIDDLRDMQTAALAVQAANSGHLVIVSVNAPTAAAALQMLQNYGVQLPSIAGSLQMIINQRFIRTCCDHCKRPSLLPPEYQSYFESAKLPVNRIVATSSCPRCDMTGFGGKHALFDIMPVSDDLRQLLMTNSPGCTDYINFNHGKVMLTYKGLYLASNGQTSIEEVSRITFDI